jgi:hypothetical protein
MINHRLEKKQKLQSFGPHCAVLKGKFWCLQTMTTVHNPINRLQINVGFWCQTIHKKNLRWFDTIFGLKMRMKSGLEKNILKFHDGLQSCCCPVQNNLPRKAELAWQVSRYLWRPPWNFKIFFSRPLFVIILSQKWCQISVRIFCLLPGTKNLPWDLFFQKRELDHPRVSVS